MPAVANVPINADVLAAICIPDFVAFCLPAALLDKRGKFLVIFSVNQAKAKRCRRFPLTRRAA
jgi:hypothetical protein